jgi:hypothetical protein
MADLLTLHSGVVIDKIGWRWCFWLIAMQFAIMVVVFYLFVRLFPFFLPSPSHEAHLLTLCGSIKVPETRYIRSSVHNIDTGSKEKINELVGDGADSPRSPSVDVAKDESGDVVHLEHGKAEIPPLKTFRQSESRNTVSAEEQGWSSIFAEADPALGTDLAIYTGRKSPASFWRIFFRPFSVMLSPVVLWAALIVSRRSFQSAPKVALPFARAHSCSALIQYGTTSALFVVLSVLQSQIWASPPYFFNAEQVGYTGAGQLVLMS